MAIYTVYGSIDANGNRTPMGAIIGVKHVVDDDWNPTEPPWFMYLEQVEAESEDHAVAIASSESEESKWEDRRWGHG